MYKGIILSKNHYTFLVDVFQAVDLVKPGGILVYSTCTITLEENEQNVAWALEKFPQIELVPLNLQIGGPGIAHVSYGDSLFFNTFYFNFYIIHYRRD